MKKSLILLLSLVCFATIQAQNSQYTVSSYQEAGNKAPNTHYIGEAYLNALVRANDTMDYNITKATFKANSTLDWHRHATPQVLIVVEGEGYYQERGKTPIRMKVGDVITCAKETEHWHASSKESDVTYLAIYGGDQPTVWTEVVSQAYYDSVAKTLQKN